MKEEEMRRINEEASDNALEYQRIEKELRTEIAKLNRQSLEDSEKKESRIRELKEKLASAIASADASEKDRIEVERQLSSLTASLKEQQTLLEHKSNQQRELTRKLQEQVAILTEARNELSAKVVQLEATTRSFSTESGQKDAEIDRLKKENDKLEELKRSHISSIQNLEGTLLSLKEKVLELNIEGNIVDDLRRELSIIPELKDELTRVVNALSITQDALEKERVDHRNTIEDRDRFQDLNSHLESHSENLRSEVSKLKEENEALQGVEQEVLFVNKELEHSKKLNSDLEQKLAKMTKQKEEREDRVKVSSLRIANELGNFQTWIESALAGELENVDADEGNDLLEQELVGLDGMKSVIMGTKSRVVDAIYEIVHLRDNYKTLTNELDSKNTLFSNLDVEKSELQKELLSLRKLASEQEKALRTLDEQKANMERNITELEDIVEDQQEEERSRSRFVLSLLRQLKSTVTDRNYDGSPVKGGKSSSIEMENITWETVQAQFSEQISKHIIERDALKKERINLEAQVAELEDSYIRQTNALREAQEQYEEDRKENDLLKQKEIDEMRRKYEDELDSLLAEYKLKIKDFVDKDSEQQAFINELNIKYKKASLTVDVLKSDIESLHIEKEKLQGCLRLMARGVRPMKNKISDLKDHKKILALQVRYLERLQKNIHDSVKQLSGEFQLEDEFGVADVVSKPKASFRSAAIAVIAFIKLNKLRNKEKKIQVYNVGDDKVQLLPEEEIPHIDTTKLPFGADIDKSNVQSFLQLCSYLDPKVDEKRASKDMWLIMALQDGLDGLLSKRLNSSLNTSMQTPSKRKVSFIENSIAHQSPAKRTIERVQKTTVGVTKILRDLAKERNSLQKELYEFNERMSRLQKTVTEAEENARKKQELVSFMETRIEELQSENMELIQPEKYNLLQREIEKLRDNYAHIQYEKEQFKQEFENQMTALDNYRKDVQELQDKLRERTSRLEVAQKELQSKRVETESLQSIINKHTEMLRDLETEKNKYEALVTDLREKLYKRQADNAVSARFAELSSTPVSPARPEGSVPSSSSLSPSFSNLRKRVERDLNESQIMMKQLTESTAKTNREVYELDRELKHARKHLAELQQNLSGGFSPNGISPSSPITHLSAEKKQNPASAVKRRDYSLDDSTQDLDVQDDLFSLTRPPSRRSKRPNSSHEL